MPWEKREGRGRYYTRTRRVDGRRVREYIGGGVPGEIAAFSDEHKRRVREETAAHLRERREELEALAAPAACLEEAAEILAHATLIAAGYHRHRGNWRLYRDA